MLVPLARLLVGVLISLTRVGTHKNSSEKDLPSEERSRHAPVASINLEAGCEAQSGWLRRWTGTPLGSAHRGSTPLGVDDVYNETNFHRASSCLCPRLGTTGARTCYHDAFNAFDVKYIGDVSVA